MNKFYRLSRKVIWNIIIFFPNIIADLCLLILLPELVVYGWLRFTYKKIFGRKYSVLFSPLMIPMSFLTARSVATQGIRADVISYDIEPVFEEMKIGYGLRYNKSLFYVMLFLDYVPIFIWGILKYDIFEFPFSGGLLYASKIRRLELLLLRLCGKKIVVYCYGSDVYLPSEIKKLGKYNTLMDAEGMVFEKSEAFIRANIRRAQKYAHVLISGADIIWLGKKAIFLPIAFDISKWPYLPLKSKKTVTLLHSANHRYLKGTRFIIKAYEDLKRAGYSVKLLLIEGATIEECYELYRKGDIFVPDVITGWYGSTQIEAMSLGRPVINYEKDRFKAYHNYYAKNCPIVSASPHNLKKVLIKLINDFELCKKLGHEGRDYVEKYHSFEFVGQLRGVIYREIWQNRNLNQKRFEKILKIEKIL